MREGEPSGGAALRILEVKEEGGGKVSSRSFDETTMNFPPPPQIRIYCRCGVVMNGMLRRARASDHEEWRMSPSYFVALKNAILAARVATHDESVNFR